MVTFRPDISYATAKQKAANQSFVLMSVGWIGAAGLGVASVVITAMALAQRMRRSA